MIKYEISRVDISYLKTTRKVWVCIQSTITESGAECVLDSRIGFQDAGAASTWAREDAKARGLRSYVIRVIGGDLPEADDDPDR